MIRLFRYDFWGFILASRLPNLMIIGATQYLTAFFLVSDFPGKNNQLLSPDFLLMVISTLMIAAGGYIINDYYDQKIDMINRPQKVVVGTLFRRRLALLAHFLLSVTAIGIGFLIDIRIGVINIFSSFSLWYYSNYLRRLTLIGNLVISFLAGLTLLMIPVFLNRNEPLVYIYSLFAMSIILIREVVKDIQDVKGDTAYGCQSIPVIWGIRGAKVFIYLVIAGGSFFLMTFLVAINNWLVQTYFFLLLPIFAWFLIKLALADTQEEYSKLRKLINIIIFSGLISMILIKPWL